MSPEGSPSRPVCAPHAKEPVAALHNGIASLDGLKADLCALQLACLNLLTALSSGAANRLVVSTSDASVATAIALPPLDLTNYRFIEVEQLAAPYTIVSDTLSADASTFAPGTYEFALKSGRSRVRLRVAIPRRTSNLLVFEKIAWAIRTTPCGAIARLTAEVDAGKTRLQIATRATGSNSKLEISDVRNNLMALAGVTGERRANAKYGGLVCEGQDARLRINGRFRKSASNRIYLADGRLCLALRGLGTARVSVSMDETQLRAAVSELRTVLGDRLEAWASGADLARRIRSHLNGLLLEAGGLDGMAIDPEPLLGGLEPPSKDRSPLRNLACKLIDSVGFWQAKIDERVDALQEHLTWYRDWSADSVQNLQRQALTAYSSQRA